MSDRVREGFELRRRLAVRDAAAPQPNQADNGDEGRYADKRGTYSKGLVHQNAPAGSFGLVNLASYATFRAALLSGDPTDFERIVVGSPGGAGRLNGPQGGLAFYLSGLDATQIPVPPAPAVASKAYAVELIELYWASLLRTVSFEDYGTNAVVADAVAELNAHVAHYAGPTDHAGKVTPRLLFRGAFPGEATGPYVSQLLLLPAAFGALTLEQLYASLPAGAYMIVPADYLAAQNGAVPPYPAPGPSQYMHDGQTLAAYTHGDVLYQAYLIANQVLSALNHPTNPGNPYAAYQTQKAFATFGGPDVTATIGAVANEALKSVWWQKWFVHLRHRPEAGGSLVHLQKTAGFDPATPDPIVASSNAVAQSAAANGGSFYLSQAFPEGSPTHPAYPTGHGAVAGACITALKFFWDGYAPIADYSAPGGPLIAKVAASNGGAWNTLADDPTAPPLTLNGELHKLASNISFGHGIHAGIHWRSDTVESIKLGEKVTLGILQDRAQTYNEHFSVTIELLDGSPYTISNR